MQVCQDFKCTCHFCLFLRLIPAKTFTKGYGQFRHQRMGYLAQVSQQGAALDKVVEMDDLLTFCHGFNLKGCVEGIRF
jgi:hypothetical protein